MEGGNIQGSLDRLQQILSGRTINDLLSIVDTKLIPHPTADENSKTAGLETSLTESKNFLLFLLFLLKSKNCCCFFVFEIFFMKS